MSDETTLLPSKRIALAAQTACALEVCAPKPGNVNRRHDFSDLRFEDFLLSAIAIGPAMEQAGRQPVGRTIFQAITATRRQVRTNTNLGIVLLLAPLAKTLAALPDPAPKTPKERIWREVQERLPVTLAALTVEDARLAFRAIRIAHAGALGQVGEADVSAEPEIDLRQAMALAQERDTIAREYALGYPVTFGIGLPALADAYRTAGEFSPAVVQTFLKILAQTPDTLIARKRGWEKAVQVSQWAQVALALGGALTPLGREEVARLDGLLRSQDDHSLNPGTTADLTAAALFLFLAAG